MIATSLLPAPLPRRTWTSSAFTLVEMLTAVTIFLILGVVLVSISVQAAQLWTGGESQNQYRQRARAALDYIGQDLKQAILSTNSNSTSLQFVIDPSQVTSFSYHDTFFWQAPTASDTSAGDLAEVGYFVNWSGTKSNLYRFFVNPSDLNGNYLIYKNPTWVSNSVISSVNPALFLENVLGMWVVASNADGTAYAGNTISPNPYRLPAYVQISLVFMNSTSAARLTSANEAGIQNLAQSSGTAQAFVKALPASISSGSTIATILVSLDNYK